MSNSALQYDHGYFSDLYKEVHGSRPRQRLDDGRFDQWEIDNYIEHLHDALASTLTDYEFEVTHREEEARWEAFTAPADPCVHDIYDVV